MRQRNELCPIQPCEVRIQRGYLCCGTHWGLVPDHVRRECRVAFRSREHWRSLAWGVRALASIWTVLDQAGTTMPPEHRDSDVRCACPACAANLARARRELLISDDLWPRIERAA